MAFRILYQDSSLVAIDKPAGFHVHPPEDIRHRIPNSQNSLFILKNQLGAYLYPVHRLDRATSGVLLFALSQDVASQISLMFQERKIQKRYFCVTRGWVEDSGKIEHPLDEKPSRTIYHCVARVELPFAVGRYPTVRYSLVEAHPESGRTHQIRRHFAHLSHHLLGDSIYGDGVHNRFFRESLGLEGLFLKAYSLSFPHPLTGERLQIRTRWGKRWNQLFDAFGTCPTGLEI